MMMVWAFCAALLLPMARAQCTVRLFWLDNYYFLLVATRASLGPCALDSSRAWLLSHSYGGVVLQTASTVSTTVGETTDDLSPAADLLDGQNTTVSCDLGGGGAWGGEVLLTCDSSTLASDTSARGVRTSPVGRSRRARSSSSAYVDTKTSKAASDAARLSKSGKRISPGRRTATRGAGAELFRGAAASASQAVGSWHEAGVVFVGAAGCVPFVGAPVADDRSAHSAASSRICRDRMPRVQAQVLSHAREGRRPQFDRGQQPALPSHTPTLSKVQSTS